MKIYSAQAQEITAHIGLHPNDNIGKWPIEIDGEKQILPFYRLPIKLLRYNVNNGRLAMEISEWETNNKRPLDASDLNDAKQIRDLLLSIDGSKSESLKDDLKKNGQMEPGVITFDGIVINGNRRMALLETLDAEEPTWKWPFLEVVRLPEEIDQTNLWKIEAGLQLSKDKIAEYHPMNELLKIREGIKAGLTPA